MAFSENSTILIFFKCSVKKLHKHYENVRGSEPRGHTYAGCVKFFNHLDLKVFCRSAGKFARLHRTSQN